MSQLIRTSSVFCLLKAYSVFVYEILTPNSLSFILSHNTETHNQSESVGTESITNKRTEDQRHAIRNVEHFLYICIDYSAFILNRFLIDTVNFTTFLHKYDLYENVCYNNHSSLYLIFSLHVFQFEHS